MNEITYCSSPQIATSADDQEENSLNLLSKQRSHVLFVLGNARPGHEDAYRQWYRDPYQRVIMDDESILQAQHYERHEVDITLGQWPPPPFQFLGLYEISVDGAEAAREVIERINTLHLAQEAAELPATWLYYPVSEKVGRRPATKPSMLLLAFANGVPGQESEFREWYATRHIRHALNIPALVSGQCFGRTHFQQPGSLDSAFSTIAIYEQEGTPESIIQSFANLPESTFYFPSMDLSRFAEWTYRPIVAPSI